MIKVLAHSPIPFDGTSFYRAYGIFPSMRKLLGGQLSVTTFRGGFTWADVGDFDVLFLQRPMTAAIYKLACYAQELGVKVWTDLDDNLYELPPESRAFFDFPDEIRKVMFDIMNISDVVTVSTPALFSYLKSLGVKSRVEVIPNALNDEWFSPVLMHNKNSQIVVWRGSETHVADLIYFNEPIQKGINESEDQYHFMGYCPWLLAHAQPVFVPTVSGEPTARIHIHKPEDIKIYHKAIQKLGPRVMHVPLIANPLNAAKSNIAWIEATFAGAVCIAPDWPEWRRPGVLNYKTMEEYTQLLTSQEDRTEEWKKSLEYIRENLLLSHVNKQRVEILKELVNQTEPVTV